jgi:hypothetical protein
MQVLIGALALCHDMTPMVRTGYTPAEPAFRASAPDHQDLA